MRPRGTFLAFSLICSLALIVVTTSASAASGRLLTLIVSGHGGIYSGRSQLVACSGSCRANYRSSRPVLVLTAVPNAGWRFVRWIGGCIGTRPTCKLNIGPGVHVTAVFTVTPPTATATTTPVVPAGTVVTVTAGKPEFVFALSSTSVPQGVVTFEVTNVGSLQHDFKICAVISDGTPTNCVGTSTSLLSPGGAANLTVTFTSPGAYEYLCTVPGHAAAGMRGLITVS
jgi:uncharacterized cupredoxin-like copper-binding protein